MGLFLLNIFFAAGSGHEPTCDKCFGKRFLAHARRSLKTVFDDTRAGHLNTTGLIQHQLEQHCCVS